jgi:hypothetical protein
MLLYIESEASRFPLHLQIYEEDTFGNKYFINRINYMFGTGLPDHTELSMQQGFPTLTGSPGEAGYGLS